MKAHGARHGVGIDRFPACAFALPTLSWPEDRVRFNCDCVWFEVDNALVDVQPEQIHAVQVIVCDATTAARILGCRDDVEVEKGW